MWEWPRSGINRAAHDLPAEETGRPHLRAVLHRAASESGLLGRWAALLRSEAGPGHARFLRVTRPRERDDLRKRPRTALTKSPTPWGTHQGRDQGTPKGTHQGGGWGTEQGARRHAQ